MQLSRGIDSYSKALHIMKNPPWGGQMRQLDSEGLHPVGLTFPVGFGIGGGVLLYIRPTGMLGEKALSFWAKFLIPKLSNPQISNPKSSRFCYFQFRRMKICFSFNVKWSNFLMFLKFCIIADDLSISDVGISQYFDLKCNNSVLFIHIR